MADGGRSRILGIAAIKTSAQAILKQLEMIHPIAASRGVNLSILYRRHCRDAIALQTDVVPGI